MADRARRITLAEQRDMADYRPQLPSNFVPAAPQRRVDLPAQTSQAWQMDVTPGAQQIIEVRTSAVDRAKGFQISFVPVAVAFGLLVVFVSLAFENDFWSLASLLLFWATFVLTWGAGWFVTLLMSAEGVSFFEAREKWSVVKAEQRERWAHFRWASGRDDEIVIAHERTTPAKLLLLLVGLGFCVVAFVAVLEGWLV
jgi:hypothetical protein